ncbi:hypothetical protein BJY00DRAFT_313913 [Aspergillus carlsbadensis]|nr:hypothetical protein BJY00DRAFT_313913 [Aspergillus carlsbadensis]
MVFIYRTSRKALACIPDKARIHKGFDTKERATIYINADESRLELVIRYHHPHSNQQNGYSRATTIQNSRKARPHTDHQGPPAPIPAVHPTAAPANPPPQVQPSTTRSPPQPQTAAANPPRETRNVNPPDQTTFVAVACGCESFPETPDLIDVTIIIWPLNVDVDTDARLDIYVYSVHPDSMSPELGHASTHYSDLPPLSRLGNIDSKRVDDFLDDAEEVLEELMRQMDGDWNDDPEELRVAFVEEMENVGWEGVQ